MDNGLLNFIDETKKKWESSHSQYWAFTTITLISLQIRNSFPHYYTIGKWTNGDRASDRDREGNSFNDLCD